MLVDKVITVTSCQTCPYEGLCPAWKALTAKEKFAITCGNDIPATFILKECHLEDKKV